MPIANSTRMLVNRGNKPSELMAKCRFDSNKAPVITAGSSHAADMLKQLGPKLQGMGFNVDLDSNADHIPVMGFPNGLDGKQKSKRRKFIRMILARAAPERSIRNVVENSINTKLRNRRTNTWNRWQNF